MTAPTTPAPVAGAAGAGRSWTLEFPPGLPLLSLNLRLHWAERNRRNAEWKQAAWALARQQRIPALGRIAIIGEYQPPDRRRRDEDNLVLAIKSATDGIRAAGVVEDDSSEFVRYDGCRIGERHPKGRLILTVTELTP
jgi:crossover junction endodeoxyribonuclease RusA